MAGAIHRLETTARRTAEYIARRGGLTFLVLGVVVGGVWLFGWLAVEVTEGDTEDFDHFIVRHVAAWQVNAPDWLNEIGRDCTALGGIAILSLMTLAVVGYLMAARKWHAAGLLVLATGGAMLLSNVLKASFGRDRPDLIVHTSHVVTSSFPSGHSMLAASVWLTLGAMLSRLVPDPKLKAYCMGCSTVPPILTGLSRVWTGVHWPTDVLAGWCIGCAWAAFCWTVTSALQRRGKVETDQPGSTTPTLSGTTQSA